jgi:hypothetical protein
VVDAPPSNIDGFLLRNTCVSSTKLYCLFGRKYAFLPLENFDSTTVFLAKTNSILREEQCA